MLPEIQVEIHKLGNHYVAIAKGADGREILRNEFQHETTHLTYLGPLWLVDQESLVPDEKHRLSDLLKGRTHLTQVAAQGRRLFQHLFGDGDVVRQYLAKYPDETSHQLTLIFTPQTMHLTRQPWEYLFNGKHFPCLAGELLLSRRPFAATPVDIAPAPGGPLRILFIVAAPTDQVAIDAAAELEIFQTALEQWLARGIVELDVLPEPTSAALLARTREKSYHIIHYVGHAAYHLPQHQGFLCFEDDLGQAELLNGTQLARFLKGKFPGLLTFAACRKSQVGVLDAFQSVAAELMDSEIPSVLTVPVSLSAPKTEVLYRTLYGNLALGRTVQESLHKTRVALYQIDLEPERKARRFEWGMPVLYQRAANLALVQPPSNESSQSSTFSYLPAAPLVGRTREIQAVRRALREEVSIFYVLGGEGVGKHMFTAYTTDHLSARPGPVLTIRCRDVLDPLASLVKIADFWKTNVPEVDQQASDLLLDAHQPAFQRAQKAQRLLANRRYLLVFENLDAWFDPRPEAQARMQNSTLSQVLLGLLSEPGKALFFFTGERRWEELSGIGAERRREIQLPLLSPQYATQVINQLPTLRQIAGSSAEKRAVYAQLGGHPQALRFLDRWLMLGNSLQSLDAWGPTEARSSEIWADLLIEDILAQMDPGEYSVLQALSVLMLPFDPETISNLTQVTDQYADPLIDDWLHFGLVEPVNPDDGAEQFRVIHPVRRVALAKLGESELAALHLQAARYYAAPFYDAARRQILARNITTWTDARIGWLARDASGILGIWLRQEQTSERHARLMASAYAWQYHLVQAGDIAAAIQIIQTIAPILNQQGQSDLSRELLHRTLGVGDNAPGTGHEVESFVRLQLEEGPLTTALNIYENVYQSLDPDEAGVQRAFVLLRAGTVKQRLSNQGGAIQDFKRALSIAREEQDQAAEAECLYKLSTAYRESHDLREALVCSQAAKEHFEALTYPNNLAIVEREQGLILEQMDRPEGALKRFAASLKICRQLGDQRCIAENLVSIGRLFEKLGRTEMAIQVIEEALRHYEYLRNPEHSAVLSLLEELYAHQQRLDEAVSRLKTAKGGQ